MNSLDVLQSIGKQQGLEGNVIQTMASVSQLLSADMQRAEEIMFLQISDAPTPVDEISAHILGAGGKRIRPALCLLASRLFGPAKNKPVELAVVCELLHNATLLHDDVIDEGDVRRGRPAARMVWSNALSVLGGDFMLMKCVDMMSAMDRVYLSTFVETLNSLVNGEIVQLRYRGKPDMNETDYFDVVNGKTSSLFRFATMTGAVFGGAEKDACRAMARFGQNTGIAFQLIDDVLDFSTDAEILGKDLLSDVRQGKMTLPVIEAAVMDSSVLRILKELIDGSNVETCAEQIADIVIRTGSLERVREKALQYTRQSLDALEVLDETDRGVLDLLRELSWALLNRCR